MFKKQPRDIADLLRVYIRKNGLETPLLQRRLIEAWDEVVGSVIAAYTEDKSIRNQTLWVKISSPAARSELQMRRTKLILDLNNKVGANVITEIKIY